MFTRDRSGTDPVQFSDRIGLLFTRDRSGTGPERIQNWTCKTAGPVFDPFRTGSRTVPCKQRPLQSGSVRNGSGPVPCKRSLKETSFSKATMVMRFPTKKNAGCPKAPRDFPPRKDGILYPRRVVLGLPSPFHRVCADGRTVT